MAEVGRAFTSRLNMGGRVWGVGGGEALMQQGVAKKAESTTLLKVIKNPFRSAYLPVHTVTACRVKERFTARFVGTIRPATPNGGDTPVCFIVGAVSTGHTIDDDPYMKNMFSVSRALSRITTGIEHHRNIM
jgi:rRNA pseudouridine-1189 N-methylase Emg1 (Nep1/Mra1 family)